MSRFLRSLFLFLLLCVPAQGGGKSSGLLIGFHPEGDSSEGARMVRQDPSFAEPRWFRISPEISTRHINGFAPFAAEDGSFGAALHLTEEGMRARNVMCNTYTGKLLRIIVNNRALDTIRIDYAKVDEPYIVIWKGLTQRDLDLMGKKLTRIDDKTKRKSR